MHSSRIRAACLLTVHVVTATRCPKKGPVTRHTTSQKGHETRDTTPPRCGQTDTCENITFFKLHWLVVIRLIVHEDILSPWRGECDSDQCPRWSGGYDACLDSETPGFDPQLRHRVFFGLWDLFDPMLQ